MVNHLFPNIKSGAERETDDKRRHIIENYLMKQNIIIYLPFMVLLII